MAEISELGSGSGVGVGAGLCGWAGDAAAIAKTNTTATDLPSHPLAPISPAREDQPINAIPKKRQLKWRQIAPDVAICVQLRGTVNRSRPTVGANRPALLFPGHSYCSTRPISQAPPKAC